MKKISIILSFATVLAVSYLNAMQTVRRVNAEIRIRPTNLPAEGMGIKPYNDSAKIDVMTPRPDGSISVGSLKQQIEAYFRMEKPNNLKPYSPGKLQMAGNNNYFENDNHIISNQDLTSRSFTYDAFFK